MAVFGAGDVHGASPKRIILILLVVFCLVNHVIRAGHNANVQPFDQKNNQWGGSPGSQMFNAANGYRLKLGRAISSVGDFCPDSIKSHCHQVTDAFMVIVGGHP